MNKYTESKRPEIWEALRKHNIVNQEGAALYPEARKLMQSLEPWERHIPILPNILEQWKAEIKLHNNSSYAAILQRDIQLASECNKLNEEMIVSFAKITSP